MYYLYCSVNKPFVVSVTVNARQALYGWTESTFSHALKTIEKLVLDLSWLNCGPERWVTALTEWKSSPGKAHNHGGPIGMVEKRPDIISQDEQALRKRLHLRLILRCPDRSLHTKMSPLGPQLLQDIHGVRHSYVQCTKGRYLSLSLHLRDATVGLPFLFSGIQHFRHSSLDLKGV